MSLELSHKEQGKLREIQRRTRDKEVYRKAMAALMLGGGFSAEDIAFALGIGESTVYRYASHYTSSSSLDEYLSSSYIGSSCRLSDVHLELLEAELDSRLYQSCSEVAAWVKARFGINYSDRGMLALLHRLDYSYKQSRHRGTKSDPVAQTEWVEEVLEPVLEEVAEERAALFYADGVHPLHNTTPTRGWIKRGKDFEIKANTGRKRVNINGAINAHKVDEVFTDFPKRVNAQSTIRLLSKIEKKHPRVERLYVVVDNAPYNRAKILKEWLKDHPRIEILYLPPYAPNLNLIERLWKFMKKKVIRTAYYESYDIFRREIGKFFQYIRKYKSQLNTLLTLNFHIELSGE